MKNLISVWKTGKTNAIWESSDNKKLALFLNHLYTPVPTPSPNDMNCYYFQEMVNNFKNKPKFRKEILEADTKDGGMKLPKLERFDSSLKKGWLKRFIRTSAKWKESPKNFDLSNVFKFRTDCIERVYELIFNLFWRDVLNSKGGFINSKSIFQTPIRYNNIMQLQIKRE